MAIQSNYPAIKLVLGMGPDGHRLHGALCHWNMVISKSSLPSEVPERIRCWCSGHVGGKMKSDGSLFSVHSAFLAMGLLVFAFS